MTTWAKEKNMAKAIRKNLEDIALPAIPKATPGLNIPTDFFMARGRGPGRKSPPKQGQQRNPSGAAGLSLGVQSRAELRVPPGCVWQAQGIGAEAVAGPEVWGPETEQGWDAPGNRVGAEARQPATGTGPGRRATREPRVRRGRAGDCSAARRSLSNVHQRRR